ncbi:MAG: ATP-dependent helicase [Lentisphaeria bacterium]|nr:ATP-dependent helicase [Lentisphaeria bacterium]
MPIDFASELNPEQLAVARSEPGVSLVVAGAGTGKTRALTYRVAWLLEQGVPANTILLLTFTNRAAREMLRRVEQLTGCQSASVRGGTFHRLGSQTLRDYGTQIGVPENFSILDRDDARRLVGACINDLGVKKGVGKFPGRGAVLGLCGLVKNTLRPIEEVVRDYPAVFQDRLDDIVRVLEEYEDRKSRQGVLDFDDLLIRFLDLLEHAGPARDVLVKRYRHVLVDEFQDTNAVQSAIVRILSSGHGNLCVVGDDAQSIYKFRGAVFENILDFHKAYPQAKGYKLETNYRSVPEILALANASIGYNRRRLPKELRGVRPPGLKPRVVTCEDQAAQTRFIGQTIEEKLAAGVPPDEISVLYRSHYHSLQIQMDLHRRGLSFRLRGGIRFFEQAHVKDILAFPRVILNGLDETAWLRILPQLPKVGEKTAAKFWRHIAGDDSPLAAALNPSAVAILPAAAREDFETMREMLIKAAAADTPAELLETVLNGYYREFLNNEYDNARQRLDDVYGVIDFAREYGKLDEFLSELALVGESDRQNMTTREQDGSAVVLSTIHQAKGLEWEVVFIPWLTAGRFPVGSAGGAEDEEEERRVFHVAVTRAKDELFLIAPKTAPNNDGRPAPVSPSRFLFELPSDLVEKTPLSAAAPTGAFQSLLRRQSSVPEHLARVHDDDLEYDYDTPF